MYTHLQKQINRICRISGIIGAFFLVAILSTIILQMVLRWFGMTLPGAANYAGYFMASASFLMLAHALNEGAHIRVSLVLDKLGRFRRFGEIWCYGVASAIATYFSYYAIKSNYWSWKLNDISQGQDAIAIWIPQIPMSIGVLLLALTLWSHFLGILFNQHLGIDSSETVAQGEKARG